MIKHFNNTNNYFDERKWIFCKTFAYLGRLNYL